MADDRVDGTSDARTRNDAVRHRYRVLTDAEKADMAEIKDLGADFLELIDRLGGGRELALARTRVEEAVMWAVKHITAEK